MGLFFLWFAGGLFIGFLIGVIVGCIIGAEMWG